MAGRSPSATVVIPTRARPDYLDVALGSIVAQSVALGAEVLVISDGPDAATAAVTDRHGVPRIDLTGAAGLNAARNAGVDAARSELIVFVDDDVIAPPGWLAAMLEGAGSTPEVAVFGGPIRPLLEGGGPRACGREPAPITALNRGPHDRDVEFVWGANMAIRRAAVASTGRFDEALWGRGDEEDWLRRYREAGGRVRYIAGAGLQHRRTDADSTIRRLSAAAYALGQTARRYDVRKGSPPPLWAELRTLLGCGWHAARRRCAYGIVLGAHSAGRVRETLRSS